MENNSSKKRFNIWKNFRFFFYLILAIVVFVLISGGLFAYQAQAFIDSSWTTKNHLEQAVNSFQLQDFVTAKEKSIEAEQSIQKALVDLAGLKSKRISKLFNNYEELEQIEELLEIGQAVSGSLVTASDLAVSFEELLEDEINFQDLDVVKKSQVLIKFVQALPEINGLKANLDLAVNRLEFVELRGWLTPISNRFESIKNDLTSAWFLTEKSLPLLELSPQFIGYPKPTTFLVLLQNSDEMRPTGGFLGSYSVLRTNRGQVEVIITADSYHLDMPVQDRLNTIPPTPLAKYLGVEKWYLRDANWSPDWPTSAQKIEEIYREIVSVWPSDKPSPYNGQFDVVIGITPQVVADLLKIVGAIEVDGQIYNSENFHHQLQYQVEMAYREKGISSWDRKDVIGELLGIIETRLMALSSNDWPYLLQTVINNLEEKDIIMYFKDLYAHGIVSNLNWAGEIQSVDKDYLMIVDANLAALKTDAVMTKTLEYILKEVDDNFVAKLKLNYSHGGGIDWRTSRYRSLTRIYLPILAENVSQEGFSQDFKVEKDTNLDKTVVSGFISVDASTDKDIVINYTLDKGIIAQNYNLYIQKQPGSYWQAEVKLDLEEDYRIASFYPSLGAELIKDHGEISWESEIDSDKVFNVSFE